MRDKMLTLDAMCEVYAEACVERDKLAALVRTLVDIECAMLDAVYEPTVGAILKRPRKVGEVLTTTVLGKRLDSVRNKALFALDAARAELKAATDHATAIETWIEQGRRHLFEAADLMLAFAPRIEKALGEGETAEEWTAARAHYLTLLRWAGEDTLRDRFPDYSEAQIAFLRCADVAPKGTLIREAAAALLPVRQLAAA